MIGCFNCLITEWLVKNEAANAPTIFEEFVMVMINCVIKYRNLKSSILAHPNKTNDPPQRTSPE